MMWLRLEPRSAWTNLSSCNLYAADLSGAKLDRTNLRNANLREALLTDTDSSTAFLEGARGIPPGN